MLVDISLKVIDSPAYTVLHLVVPSVFALGAVILTVPIGANHRAVAPAGNTLVSPDIRFLVIVEKKSHILKYLLV
jgi:hypothetical protein